MTENPEVNILGKSEIIKSRKVDRGTKNELFEFDSNIIRLNLSVFDSISKLWEEFEVVKV